MNTDYGQSTSGSAGVIRAGRTAALRWAGLEGLEPRLLLSGSVWADALDGVAAEASADATDRFAWSGYDVVAAGAEFHYTFTGLPELADGGAGVAVTLAGESAWDRAGEAMVPVRVSRVLLPPGMRIVSAEATLSGGKVIARGVDLGASPTPVPYGLDAPTDVAVKPVVSASSFPSAEAVQWSTELLAGYALGRIEVFPVHYDAAGGTVTFYSRIDVTLKLAPDEPGGVGLRESAEDLWRVLDMVDNDSAAGGYDPAGGEGDEVKPAGLPGAGTYEYVVVTSGALADEFQRLVDDKIAKGIPATLVTTEYIDANYVSAFAGENDAAGRIRQFLTDAYAEWNTRWVLLGGDVDQVAYRMVTVSANGEEGTFPSDMYFACLDGPYNGNADGDWAQTDDGTGGWDVDRAPELFVGRATVSTAVEAGRFVDKTIQAGSGSHPNPSTCLWLGEQLDNDPTWGGDVMDAILAESFPAQAEHIKLYERDGSYGTSNVVAALNASPIVVNHLGHSSWQVNAKLRAADIAALTNEAPYFFYSQGCQAGQFQRDDAVAEHHVQSAAGAWAVIMNTHYGWYLPGGIGGSYHWHSQFWDAVFHEGITRVGEAHFDSKTDLGSAFGTDRWVFFACELFGDPETSIRISDPAGPRVRVHEPSGNATGAVSTVRLSFTQRMDRAGFDPVADVVRFTGPGGTDLSGQITGYRWADPWTLEVHFLPQSGFGTYELTVGPDVADYDGEPMDQDGDAQAGEAGEDAYTASFTLQPDGGATVLYTADMSTDPGWTLDGGTGDFCWQWGVPTGQGGDPGRAFTGDSVMGYNLNGTYPDNMASAQYATTPAFDCSAASFVTLSFRRWLGVESDDWDHAAIQVSADGGPWVTVWSNGETGVDDWAWTGQDLDITSVAAGSASVRIRWGMGPTDSSETYGGWNIDDVVVTGSSGRAVIYSEDMADDPGWELDEGTEVGGWEWGIPSGNAGDPDSGYTGDHVIGFNLDGAYPDNLYDPLYGTTPAFDCSDALVVTLRYWRWLGVEDDEWDQATIEVSADGGPWIAVWSNGADAISDTAWVPETVDISAEASFSSSVRIRWGMGPTDGLVTYGGWNIDDVVVTDGVTFDVLYSAYMSDDPQWTLESGQGRYSWQWGRPLGGDDPDSGATGDTVMGYNLGGPYPDNMSAPEYATSPAFDCSGYSGLTLTFQRWLGVENNEWDHATVEASANGGPWVVVWSNGTGTITDSSWTSQSVDISAVADGQASVRLRWGMGPTDTSVTYCGWNIDDVLVVGRQAGPSVFTHSPFADVEAGLDHLDVTFASPIDETTFDEARVTLTGPSGAPVTLTGLGHLSGSTYRVQFDALAELGTYTLRVGPGVTDDNGNPMDQDGDGTLGEESDDVYVGTFAVVPPDTTGPRVDSHSPAGQVAEAQGALRLHFDEPMDTTSFGLDDIAAFTGPGGDLMPAIYGFLWLDPRTLEIRFDWQGASG
ncbi:MAG TPA: C25 family cysteine peptidase, partial [Phycisphaerae bacterium]|nr:C25 family cysteine peptidase [Phycisphaerae bacterium]